MGYFIKVTYLQADSASLRDLYTWNSSACVKFFNSVKHLSCIKHKEEVAHRIVSSINNNKELNIAINLIQ